MTELMFAQLKEVFFIQGVKNGNLGPTIVPGNLPSSFKNFKMFLKDDGSGDILIQWEEPNYLRQGTVSGSMLKFATHAPVPLPKNHTVSDVPAASPKK